MEHSDEPDDVLDQGFLDLVREQLERSRQELARLDDNLKVLQANREAVAEQVRKLEAILSSDEQSREVEEAAPEREQEKPKWRPPITTPRGRSTDAAVEILRRHGGGPMHYREISDLAQEAGLWNPIGRTPHFTLSRDLSAEINNRGAASRFVRPRPGWYALRHFDPSA